MGIGYYPFFVFFGYIPIPKWVLGVVFGCVRRGARMSLHVAGKPTRFRAFQDDREGTTKKRQRRNDDEDKAMKKR